LLTALVALQRRCLAEANLDARRLTWLAKIGCDPDNLCGSVELKRFEDDADEDDYSSCLYEACLKGEVELCQWLVDRGAASSIYEDTGRNGFSPIYGAIENGHLNIVEWLFLLCPAIETLQGSMGGREYSCMHAACENGHLDIAQCLNQLSANEVLNLDENERTPIYLALIGRHLEVAKWLFEIDSSTIRTVCNNETPMHVACECGDLTIAKWLFEVGAADDINAKPNGGNAPIWHALIVGLLPTVQWLVDVGANIKDARFFARGVEDIDMTTWLILNGAANDDSGHIDAALLFRSPYTLPNGVGLTTTRNQRVKKCDLFKSCLYPILSQHFTFTRVILTATLFSSTCFALLRGYENTVLVLIADFVGVARGRILRNARETILIAEAAVRIISIQVDLEAASRTSEKAVARAAAQAAAQRIADGEVRKAQLLAELIVRKEKRRSEVEERRVCREERAKKAEVEHEENVAQIEADIEARIRNEHIIKRVPNIRQLMLYCVISLLICFLFIYFI
jgi:ankyrin repeat protein